jgi:hypothetical protein
MHDRCTVCAKHTIGSKIILDTLDGKLVSFRLEVVLTLISDRCTVHAERSVSSEIIFDAPDGKPR